MNSLLVSGMAGLRVALSGRMMDPIGFVITLSGEASRNEMDLFLQ
jgi:hypothetical protein